MNIVSGDINQWRQYLGYFRNASWALNLISTFLLIQTFW